MNIKELVELIEKYNNCETDRSWTMSRMMSMDYENDYIKVIRIDSSNKWVEENKMSKMWSIIFESKKSINRLPAYWQLVSNFDACTSPITRGKNKGCFGLRFYNMRREPCKEIIKTILDFLFQ